ncbi:MAG: D-alanine--D-alanine ligase [Myxococcales bacterium]|nr:D-alanine--D-alanine ligase [Myxococcales bacterium]
MNQGKVAVIRGGISRERDISMWSGSEVLSVLGDRALDVVIEKDGTWRFGHDGPLSLCPALERLRGEASVVFLALHGPFGEDGTVQALLDSCGLAYTGSRGPASALAMDKARTKLVYTGSQLPTPPSVCVLDHHELDQKVEEALTNIPGPWVVKPARDGSSFGVEMCEDPSMLSSKARGILESGQEVVIEARIIGREFSCGVLEDEEGRPFALPVTEIIPEAGHTFFDFAAKYTPGHSTEVTPAEIPKELAERVQRRAVSAHRILGCRHLSRTDFMHRADETFLLETNTLPGMTKASIVPQAAAAIGMSFADLVSRLLSRAVADGPASWISA